MWVIAHRGSSRRAPENTLSAIRRAIEDGADYAEVDVRETADGEVVLLHDDDFQRTTGRRAKVWRTTYAEIARLDAGSWFAPEFAGERIPTLAEVIEVARGRIKLDVEIKVSGRERALVENVVRILKKTAFESECFVTSASPAAIEKVKQFDPGIEVGLVIRSRRVAHLDAVGEHVALRHSLVTPAWVSAARARGQQVHAWTVNERAPIPHLVALGIDGILTDDPAWLRRVLAERG